MKQVVLTMPVRGMTRCAKRKTNRKQWLAQSPYSMENDDMGKNVNCAGYGREKLNIRPARHDDAAALADVHLDSRREAMPWLPILHSRPDATAYFAGHVLLHEQVFVAELNQ